MFAAIGSIIAAIAAIFVAYVGLKILRILGRLLGVAAFKASEEIEKRRKR